VDPQGARRQHGASDAVSPALAQHFAHGQAGLPPISKLEGSASIKPWIFAGVEVRARTENSAG